MKKALLFVVVLAVAAPGWAGPPTAGDPIADSQYDHFLGHRDWKDTGRIEFAGGYKSWEDVDTWEFRYMAPQTVTFDTVRTLWDRSGKISGGWTINCSVQSDTYSGPNYHDGDWATFMPVSGSYPAEYIAAPDPSIYDGSWHIPSGTVLGGGGNVAQ
ncbi:unnamed protein product, partial [marine sediment metagenome]